MDQGIESRNLTVEECSWCLAWSDFQMQPGFHSTQTALGIFHTPELQISACTSEPFTLVLIWASNLKPELVLFPPAC